MGSISIAGSGGSSGITVGTTTITGGVNGDLLFDNAGVVGEETISVALDVIGAAQGDILYRDAAVWKVLAPGTNGFLLQTGGAGANPSWITPPGSAGSITVGTTTITGGTDGHVVYQQAVGLFGEAANFTIVSGNPNVTAGNQYEYNAMPVITADTGLSNYWFGGAGNLTTTGQHNFGDGPSSLSALTIGNDNTAYGNGVLKSLTSGSANMAIGTSAMATATTGVDNLAIGVNALAGGGGGNTASENVALGTDAMQFCTSGGSNVAIGSKSLQACSSGGSNVGVGQRALNALLTGVSNVVVGTLSAETLTADNFNVIIGVNSLLSNNGGDGNVMVGYQCGAAATAAARDVVVGYNSGQNISTGADNIIIGTQESTITSGSTNISVGHQVAVPSATANNQLVIGNYIYGTGLSGTGVTISPGKIGLGVKAPAQQLDVNGGIQANDQTALIYAATAMNNGAGTGSGVTFTNAPGASVSTGNPTKWVPFNDAGTIRYIPMF